MYTITQARDAIGNTAHFARGRAYAQAGHVLRHKVVADGGRLMAYGTVRGHGQHYSVGFTYDEEKGRFTQASCDCPAFERAAFGCKHVAALMIAVHQAQENKQRRSGSAEPPAMDETDRVIRDAERTLEQAAKTLAGMDADVAGREDIFSWIERITKGREQERLRREQGQEEARRRREKELQEARRRQQEEQERERARMEREQRESFVRGLLDGAQAARSAHGPLPGAAQGEKVRLIPVLSMMDDGVTMELRIGRRRMYIVRSIDEFARRIAERETAVYGKELTLRHLEEEFAEEDRPLLWHVLALADGAPRMSAGQLFLQGAQLDQTMRLLLGRAAETRGSDGQFVPVTIREGAAQIEASLVREGGDVRLSLGERRCVRGVAGAYFFEEENIVCVFGAAYDRIAGLLSVGEAYPGGLLLGQAQLPAVCARVIAPAGGSVQMREGGDILEMNTPMPLTVRYYIDLQDGAPAAADKQTNKQAEKDECLTCRLETSYLGQAVRPGEEAPHIRRDEEAEALALAAAKAVFPDAQDAQTCAFYGSDEETYALLSERLPELSAYGEVMVAERLAQMNVKKRRAMTFGLSAAQEELILKSDLGGLTQDDLRAAYLAYRQRRRFVRLKDGTFLSGEALEQAAKTGEMLDTLDVSAEQVKEGARIPASRALYIEEALKNREEATLSAPGEVRDWMDRLRRAQAADVEPPRSLNATLRGYQETGLSWLCALSEAGFGGILADDMGLGKTIQALAMLLHDKERGERVRALVICPASLQLNWLSEAERFAPTLRAQAMLGDGAQRKELIASIAHEDGPELLIASYDQVRRDAQLYEGTELSHILLDEAQHIKNAASLGARAVKTLKAKHRFAMTGTPVENRLSELWSIFDFLMPGYLYSYKKFKERFEQPIVHDADEEARERLRMMTAPFILRRMKKDVLDDLPDKTETIMTSEMTAPQGKLYAAYAARLIAEADGGLADAQSRMKILAGLTRLRQLCCDPRLCVEEYDGGSGKLAQCVELVRELHEDGHRMLIFSQFTSMLEILKKALEAEGFAVLELTGETGKRERMQLAGRFNGGEGDVFLISLKAGGTGLNLTGADVVIHYDPWWNTAAQNQATDRAYRIGQTRGVQVISLIASGTVEERILRLQQKKAALSDGVLEGGDNLFTLDAEAFKDILRG